MASSQSPTSRSRTLLFISYRDSRARSSRFSRSHPPSIYDYNDSDGNENDRLMLSQQPGHVSLDADLPPKWVDISEQVQDILGGTHAKITALEKLHAKHALPGFTDRTAEEREIEATTTDITKDFRQCQKLIQRIGSDQAHAFPPSASPSAHARHEVLAAKNVQRGLAAKVQELSTTFRKKQRVYMEKLQGHAIKNQDLLIASGTVSSKGSEGMSAVDEDIQAAQYQSQSQATSLVHDVAPDLRTRDRELTEIAKSISELAELFKDLSVLVIDQGTLLDSVEYNIEQTSAQVAEAVKELDVATTYQKNTGRRKCIFLLLLIIFGLIMVLIFKPRRHSSTSPSSSASSSHSPPQSPPPSVLLPPIPRSEAYTPVYFYRRTFFDAK